MSRAAQHRQWWTPARLQRYGWVYYGQEPFKERLDRLEALIGSLLYETMTFHTGEVYVRRIE